MTRTHDLGLVRLLGLVTLLPVANALADPSAGRVFGAALGVVALAAHQLSLNGSPRVAGRVTALLLAALTVACGALAHVATGQPWTLVVLAAGLQCAVRLDPLPLAVAGVAACTAAAPLGGRTHDLGTTLVLVAGPSVVAALRHRLLVTIAELHATREQLAETAVLRERDRFSDDLHDLLGHTLSVIAVSAQVVQRLAPSQPERAAEAGAEIETLARGALDDVRAAVLGYRARTVAAESSELQRALTTAGIEATFDLVPTAGLDVDETLALVLRETVTNIVRHSHATGCRVTLRRDAGGVTLEVADNGTGNAEAAARAEAGLATVRARLARFDGQLDIGPLSPHGLRVTVQLPVTAGVPS